MGDFATKIAFESGFTKRVVLLTPLQRFERRKYKLIRIICFGCQESKMFMPTEVLKIGDCVRSKSHLGFLGKKSNPFFLEL